MNSVNIVKQFIFCHSNKYTHFRNSSICVTHISYLVSVQKVYLHAYSGLMIWLVLFWSFQTFSVWVEAMIVLILNLVPYPPCFSTVSL
jgi:hypothetical protein